MNWVICLPKLANANCNQEKNPELRVRAAEIGIRIETSGKTRSKKLFRVSEAKTIRSR